MSPGVGGDSQVYHLPGIVNILKSGSLVNFDPEQLYRPPAFMNWYPRGFEALGALFYALPLSKPVLILFKLTLFGSFFLLLKRQSSVRGISFALFAFLISMQFVRDDLGNLKNDLVMAVPMVWAAVRVLNPGIRKRDFWLIPLLCSVSMTVKSSALAYSAPVLLLWLWKFRHGWPKQLIAGLGIIIPFGLFFYWSNWLLMGNPVYPFEVKLGEWVLFAGQENTLFETTILANLDQTFLPLFFRGLLRVAGPGGTVGILGAGFWVLGMCFCRKKKQNEESRSNTCRLKSNTFFILIFWLFVFLITPFSDHNGPDIHNQLYSGNTIRMAFPFLLLLFWMVPKPLAEWVGNSAKRKNWVICGLACAALVNLFWYDAVCLLAKPENAFAWMAPVAKCFNNWVLGLWVLGAGGVCALVVLTKKRWLWGVLLVGAVAVQQAGYPESLGYTMRFKQLGESSRVFEFLKKQGFSADDTIAIHSADESSFFLACANDFLLPRTGSMRYIKNIDQVPTSDFSSLTSDPESRQRYWLILCAKDAVELDGPLRGRQYSASWSFLETQLILDRYMLLFADKYYRIYKRS